ncbi:MAG: dockerin type I domain-containing protein, partial [Clostridia bacterium]|nr:dockerin type I domain-containing protein [Clostridia bacterium]
NRITATKIKIGQVTFPAQGTISFKVDANNSKVVATKYNTHLEKSYTAADANAKLTADENGITGTIEAPTRDVVINVAYAHALVGSWTDNQMTVTLKNAFGETSAPQDISDGLAEFASVPVGRITVTLKAPGFRTFTYTTTVEEGTDPLVLSFWNDTKRGTTAEVEPGKAMANNFVVGDIAMDYIVDKYDLAAVTSYYGTYNLTDENKIRYDLNRDGSIDITDVAYVLHNFGF